MPRKKKTSDTLVETPPPVTPLPPGPPVSVLSVPRPGEAHESEKVVPPPSPVEVRKPALVPVADLLPHPRNYREHPQAQIDHLVQSMRDHGFYRNVVIARDGKTILAGHGVAKAALQAGLEKILAVRLDLDPNEPRALKLVAADNEIARLAEVDDRALTELLKDIKDGDASGLLGTGFDDAMLANLLMVTRPQSEIRDINEAAEWVGMPEYEDGGIPIKLVVSFKTEEDRDEFVKSSRITADKRAGLTWSARWPFTQRVDAASVRFLEDGDGLFASEPDHDEA